MADYASRLSKYPNKGKCGLPERIDTTRVLARKLRQLVKLVQSSKHIVILTGAGISTSAGIPDFRGPKGIWTLENEKEKAKRQALRANGVISEDERGKANSSKNAAPDASSSLSQSDCFSNDNHPTIQPTPSKKRRRDSPSPTNNPSSMESSFASACPTYTHHAITALISAHESFQYVITQNVDGLHQRSNLPRSHLSVLHGCIFTERCELCRREHFRDYDVGGVSFQKTGRKCEAPDCSGDLRDTVLDWEDELPEEEFVLATEQCRASDLVICLGTSLRIEPAGSLPLQGGKFVIVTMQETPKDDKAALIIRAKVDDVMKALMEGLGIDVAGIQEGLKRKDNDESKS